MTGLGSSTVFILKYKLISTWSTCQSTCTVLEAKVLGTWQVLSSTIFLKENNIFPFPWIVRVLRGQRGNYKANMTCFLEARLQACIKSINNFDWQCNKHGEGILDARVWDHCWRFGIRQFGIDSIVIPEINEQLPTDYSPCIAHTIQLVVSDEFKEAGQLTVFLAKSPRSSTTYTNQLSQLIDSRGKWGCRQEM